MDDYLRTVPGVSFQDRGAGQNAIVMRGISASPQTENEAVGVYYGETPIAGLSNAGNGGGGGNLDIKLVDIERIEVLRGPQGTLYGSGSMGGTVRVIPKAPNLQDVEGSISGRFSNTSEEGDNNTMIQGVINVPLIEDTLAIRAVAYQCDNSGSIKKVAGGDDPVVDAALAGGKAFGGLARNVDDIGSDEYTGFRLSTLWQASEQLDVTLTYTNQEIEQLGWPEVNLAFGEFEQARLAVRDGQNEGLSNEVDIINLTANYRNEWGTFTSASSWIDYDQKSLLDLSFFLGLPIDTGGRKSVGSFIQELRFASSLDGPLQFLGGFYYEDRETQRDFDLIFTGADDFEDDVIAIFSAPPLPETFSSNQLFVEDVKQEAYFGEVSYDVSDQLSVTVGARYFDYEQDAPTTLEGIFGDAFIPSNNEDSGSTYKFNISYQSSDDILLYAQWAEGFRLGAPQTPPPAFCDADSNGLFELADGTEIPIPDNVAPDELENYELGIKASFADNRITLSSSIYRINWEGIPVQVGLVSCGGAATINAGKSKSEGIELESKVLVAENIKLDISASYNQATLTEDAAGLGLGAVDGANLPGSADFNFTAGVEYAFSIENTQAFLRMDYSYVGEYFGNFSETGQNSGDYSMINVKLGAIFDQLSVDMFVNNLTNADEFTWNENQFSQLGFTRAYQLRPRTIGINLNYLF
jgi:outer membrane receptor protein involved in Fe transport